MIRWGVWGGAVLGLLVLAVHSVLPALFTTDPAVRSALVGGAGRRGARAAARRATSSSSTGCSSAPGDGRWLAKAMAATLVLYLPLALGSTSGAMPSSRRAPRAP